MYVQLSAREKSNLARAQFIHSTSKAVFLRPTDKTKMVKILLGVVEMDISMPKSRALELSVIWLVVVLIGIVEYIFVFMDASLGILLSLLCVLTLYGTISIITLNQAVTDALEATGLIFIYILLVSCLPWFFFRQEVLIPAVYSVVLALCFGYIYVKKISLEYIGIVKADWLRYIILGSIIGAPMGYVEHSILVPEPLVPNFQLTYFLQTLLYMILFVGLGEELLFRGLIQRKLEEAYGQKWGLVISASIFSIMHLGWRNIYEYVFVFIAGLVLGYFYQKTRNLLGPIFLHGVNNAVMLAIFPFIR